VRSTSRSAGISFSDKDSALVTLGDLEIRVGTVLKSIFIVLAIVFFFPLFKVSFMGLMPLSFSGWNAAFGKTISMFGESDTINGNFAAVLLLLIPLLSFAVVQFKAKMRFLSGKLFWTTAALALVGFVVLAVLKSVVSGMAQDNMLSAQYSGWYYLSMVLYIALIGGSVWCVVRARRTSQQTTNMIGSGGTWVNQQQ